MRTIKLRAWDKRNKRMVYDPKRQYMTERINSMLYVPDDYDFMQYTGIKDKNGKEVYEGDILDGNPLMIIVYDKILCGFVAENQNSNYKNDYCFIDDLSDIEIIGNIYENNK